MLTRRKALKDEAKVCVEHTTQSTKIKRKPPLSPKPKETVKKRGKTDSKPESKNQRAKMTSERNADHIHHIQKEPSSTNTTNLTAQTSRLAIERLMSLKYANVVERMKLTFPAKCTQLLIDCCTEHARNQVKTTCIWIAGLWLYSNDLFIFISVHSIFGQHLWNIPKKPSTTHVFPCDSDGCSAKYISRSQNSAIIVWIDLGKVLPKVTTKIELSILLNGFLIY